MKFLLIIASIFLVFFQKAASKHFGSGLKQHDAEFTSLNNNCQNSQVSAIKGVNQLGAGVDLLKLDVKAPLFQLSCKNQAPTLDGTAIIPEGVELKPLLQLNMQQKTLSAINQQQFETFKVSTFNTQIDTKDASVYDFKLNIVAGELNPNIKQIEQKLNTNNQIYQINSSKYKIFHANVTDFSKATISPEFADALDKLPVEYQKDKYIPFLQKFGTHYREGVQIGGLISQTGYTSKNYIAGDYTTKNAESNFANYFSEQLLNENLSINYMPDQYISTNVDSDYTKNTQFQQLHVEGGNRNGNTFKSWVQTLNDNPALVEQRLVNITNLLKSDLLPPKLKNKIPKLIPSMNKALKVYLIDSSGCTDSKAINYNSKAEIPDSSCYYSTYYASYQTTTGSCDSDFSDSYNLPDPVTNDFTCPGDSTEEQIGVYTYDNCQIKQYFCLRNDVPQDKRDLFQVLEICQASSLTNVFYENKTPEQYMCTQEQENELFFNMKFPSKQLIYSCSQQFCLAQQSNGIQSFSNKHVGKCSTYKIDTDQESIDNQCTGSCLVQYGKIQLAPDCDLYQYVCISNQFTFQCANQ